MAPIALTDALILAGGHDYTADSNKIMLDGSIEELDKTTFASAGWKERASGLRDFKASASGFWASAANDAVDPEAWANLGAFDKVLTVAPTHTETGVCYLTQFTESAYSLDGEDGQLLPFTLGLSGSNKQGLVRGQLALKPTSVASTGAKGTAVQLGAVGASQFLYASLHVLGTPGTTVTIQVQSDDNGGFASATTVATIGPLTVSGATWMTRVAGPITDDRFRFNVSAITGTFLLAGAIGIGF